MQTTTSPNVSRAPEDRLHLSSNTQLRPAVRRVQSSRILLITVMRCRTASPPAVFWDGTCYFGASLAAFDRVARHFSYQLVWVDNLGINAFFVASEIVGSLPFRPATFKARYGPLHMPCHGRYWVDVASVDLSDNLWTDNVSLIRLNYTQVTMQRWP